MENGPRSMDRFYMEPDSGHNRNGFGRGRLIGCNTFTYVGRRNAIIINKEGENCIDIKPGYYRTRAYKNGPWVPIRVWLEDGERCPDTNELLSDQIIKAEINRSENDQFAWTLLNPYVENNIYWKEITKEQFTWITIQKTL